MFKKYTFNWYHQGPPVHGEPKTTCFYVHKKKMRRGGFYYRAICTGDIPRLDGLTESHEQYQRNSERLEKAVRCKVKMVSGGVLCFEKWLGRTVLTRLWSQIAKLPFVDVVQIRSTNPFDVDEEPEHEDITQPEDVFL